jgi:hypothetical protein
MRRRAVGLLVVGAGRRIIAGGIGITAMSPVLDLIADGRRRQRCLPHLSRFLFVWSMQKPDHFTWFKVPAEFAHVYHNHVASCPELSVVLRSLRFQVVEEGPFRFREHYFATEERISRKYIMITMQMSRNHYATEKRIDWH